jgi:hypothetical protein
VDLEAYLYGSKKAWTKWETERDRGWNRIHRRKKPCLQVEQRANGFKAMEIGFAGSMALREADSCFRRGLVPKILSAAKQ